jgi:hypothetical protein
VQLAAERMRAGELRPPVSRPSESLADA